MRCLNPRTVGFKDDGRTIEWSPKRYNKEYATFQLPCSKCIECRLEQARDSAVRCVHEAKMYENNSFITLTYSEEQLKSPKLQYEHFQTFIKDLRDQILLKTLKKIALTREEYLARPKPERELIYKPIEIAFFATGEYGEITKRPHWHSIIFNWQPNDLQFKYTSDLGHKVFTSQVLTDLWGRGNAELGSVTFESAGYVARYSAKKLVHGKDQDHDFHPIHKRSTKHAIGKKFLESYWQDLFNSGSVSLEGGTTCSIPRYYTKWLLKNHPEAFAKYITGIRNDASVKAAQKAERLCYETNKINEIRLDNGKSTFQISRNAVKSEISKQKFKRLQQHLKGDI